MLQFIRQPLMRQTLFLLLLLAGRIVEVDITLAAALEKEMLLVIIPALRGRSPRGPAYASMVISIRRVAHRQLGDHLGVVGHFGGWAYAGGSDIANAAALGTVFVSHSHHTTSPS